MFRDNLNKRIQSKNMYYILWNEILFVEERIQKEKYSAPLFQGW